MSAHQLPGEVSDTNQPPAPDQHAENFIEAEEPFDFDNDYDSTLGDDVESSTTSLQSAVTDYIRENGRRYHAPKGEAYFLPNDEPELDRLDMFHHCLILLADGELHFAPIGPDPHRILDLGTGTGIWAIDMGDKYPMAEILGNDISPVQPNMVPPNVVFEVDDIEKDWVYSSKFDMIHGRYLAGSLRDWPRLIRQSFEYLKPGGWIEMQDFDMLFYSMNPDFKGTSADTWARHIGSGVEKLGLEPNPGNQLEGWIRDAGFVNVKAHLLPVPVGSWPKEYKLKQAGAFNLLQLLEGIEAISLRVFTHVHQWDVEQVEVLLAQVRKDMLSMRLQIQHD